jgi:hypothetical protein
MAVSIKAPEKPNHNMSAACAPQMAAGQKKLWAAKKAADCAHNEGSNNRQSYLMQLMKGWS